jgi:uncharacterized protein YndB with AHSA1/START domain
MVDILHRVGVEGRSPAEVYDKLTTIDGLAGWWTADTRGSTDVGGVVEFRFPNGGIDMEVVGRKPGEQVTWKVVGGPDEWLGTLIDFRLRNDHGSTIVLFQHQGWKEPVEFMHHCSTKWATFLMSLKALVETGEGRPAPNDVHIAWPD